MKCPQCRSSNLGKDGHQDRKQRFECKDCDRLFRESNEVRDQSQVEKICLEMYLNGMGFRAIERVTGIHHTDYYELGQRLSTSVVRR